MTTPISPTTLLGTPSTAAPQATSSATGSESLGSSQDFLKLLVAQLQNQSPDQPTDPSAMMTQLATFTEVESLQNIEQSQSSALTWQRMLTGASLVGRNITGLDANGTTVTGSVSAVRITSDGPVLTVNNDDIPLANVSQVTAATS